MKFTKRQWLTLVVFAFADFCNAICVSLQAPFYPKEAEMKGATATEYGLVFGIFELTVFLVSPIFGKYLNKIGPKFMFHAGIFTVSTCSILFGVLDKIQNGRTFIAFSFIIRIVEAMGNASFLTASFSIIAKEFPESVATTFACLETFFGLGLIVGPTVGGALYQVGGYTLPFVSLGAVLLSAALITLFILPSHGNQDVDETPTASLTKALRIVPVIMAAFSIISASVSIGFLSATLEPHLRQFNLTPIIMGLMFVITGGTYAMSAPYWGYLCDNRVKPEIIILIGSVVIVFGFSLIGPAPFIPMATELWLSIVGLIFHGIGVGAELVSSFALALGAAISHGFPDNLETYGLVSGLWTSTFALGAFVGPSVAGIFTDLFGVRNATMFVIMVHLLVGCTIAIYICIGRSKSRKDSLDKKPLLTAADDDMNTETSALIIHNATNGQAPHRYDNSGSLDSRSIAANGNSTQMGNGYTNVSNGKSSKRRISKGKVEDMHLAETGSLTSRSSRERRLASSCSLDYGGTGGNPDSVASSSSSSNYHRQHPGGGGALDHSRSFASPEHSGTNRMVSVETCA